MIDIERLRKEPDSVKNLVLRKEPDFPFEELLRLEGEMRRVRMDVEAIRKERNELAKQAAGGRLDEVRARGVELGKQLKVKEEELAQKEQQFSACMLSCPNLPDSDVPEGGKDQNLVVRAWGEVPQLSFMPRNHVELNRSLRWFDMDAGAAMSGAQFVFYREQGAKIMYALTRMMLKNNAEHGFTPVIPPYLVHERAMVNAGALPKFAGAYYQLPDEGLCLIPTSEVALTNLHADRILDAQELPLRYTAWTSCFRREAGGYGAQERGLIRSHQFEKVELYSLCVPEASNQELEFMVSVAESLLKKLELPYRVSLLAAQDCSFQSAKTYDIEVWLPGQDRFYEVSSCSNCKDFQARRASIRYRSSAGEKTRFVHTLNASSLALPRLMVAIMENFQQSDGSVFLPTALQEACAQAW
jgi:seryl-tRNA synthetase